jgi:predicted Zn-dependent protease
MKKFSIIDTTYDTIAASIDGTEYIAIPVYEDSTIKAYALPSGGAADVRGLLTLPEDAAEVYTASMGDLPDAQAAYAECERILREEI